MTVENQTQLSTKFLDKGKQIVFTILREKGKGKETIDLDDDIVIPNWDISTLTLDQMNTIGKLMKKRVKWHKLIEEKKKESQVFEDIKSIFFDALSIEVDGTQPILD